MRAVLLILIALVSGLVKADALTDAFKAGSTLGRSGTLSAHDSITTSNARTRVPAYTETPAETRYFESAGLSAAAAARAGNCTGNSPECLAIRYSQLNPGKHAQFTLTPDDVLLKKGQTIAADPQAIAGNLAGTYSACAVQTTTTPPITELRLCHEYRTAVNRTCDKIRVVTLEQIPGCTAGTFLTRVSLDPCSDCVDLAAFDFTCTATGYHIVLLDVLKKTGETLATMGSRDVAGRVDLEIPKTEGPSKQDDYYCYRSFYSQSCNAKICTLTVWIENPCTGLAGTAKANFQIPTTAGAVDTWSNQCATLEARAK